MTKIEAIKKVEKEIKKGVDYVQCRRCGALLTSYNLKPHVCDLCGKIEEHHEDEAVVGML